MINREVEQTDHQSAIIKRLFSNASRVGLKNGMNFVQRKEKNLKNLQLHSFCPKQLSHKKSLFTPPPTHPPTHKTLPFNIAQTTLYVILSGDKYEHRRMYN